MNYLFTKWFNYVLNFLEQCNTADTYNANCAKHRMKELDIDEEKVNDCMKNSFVKPGDTQSHNKLLREDREWANKLGIVI